MRGGTFIELIAFLKNPEHKDLHAHFSKSVGLDRVIPTKSFDKFKSNEITQHTLLEQLNARMAPDKKHVKVFAPTPEPPTPPTIYQRFYEDALFLAEHNMQHNPDIWAKMKSEDNVSNPVEYATAFAKKKLINMKQPRAASMQFQRPEAGTYGGV